MFWQIRSPVIMGNAFLLILWRYNKLIIFLLLQAKNWVYWGLVCKREMEIESGPDRYMASYSHLWVLSIIIIEKLGNPEFLKSWTKKKNLSTVDFNLKSNYNVWGGFWGFLCFFLEIGLESKGDVAEGGSLHPRCGRADSQASQDWDAKVGFPIGIGIGMPR